MFEYLMIGTKGNTEDSSNMCMVWQYTCNQELDAKQIKNRFCRDFVRSMYQSGDLDSTRKIFKKHGHCQTCTCNEKENSTDSYFIELAFNNYLSGTYDSASFIRETIEMMDDEMGWSECIISKKFDKIFHVEDIDEWLLEVDDCATKYN